MKNWSIDNKLWLCVLTPCVLGCGILVLVFATTYMRYMDAAYLVRGEWLSRNLVSDITNTQANTDAVKQIFERELVDLRSTNSVTLLDGDKNILVHSGESFPGNIPFENAEVLNQQPKISHTLRGNRSYYEVAFTPPSGDLRYLVMVRDRANLQVQKMQVILLLAFVAGLVLIAAIILFAFLKRTLIRPFDNLRDNLERLCHGETENLEPVNYGQPFNLLFTYLKRTAELITDSRRELQETVEQATGDLRETLETVEEQNIELNLARKQALAANKAKSEFLSNTSHEIRTPINGILGFVQLLGKSELNEQQREYLRNIEKSSHGLLTTINSILDVSKIETGQLVLDYNPFNLYEVVQDCVDMFAPAAKGKGLQLQQSIDAQVPQSLMGDPLRLKQILCNLIGNAVKFSDRGVISVHVALTEESTGIRDSKANLCFSVNDQGKGIGPDKQQYLFQLFSQGDSSDSREQGGTGLGLAVCKGLVELMQGKIGVDSSAAQGSTFWFTVTFGVNQVVAMPIQDATGSSITKPVFRANVLAVDDTPANLHLITELLKDFGVNVQGAKDGMEALGLCEKQQFDLIFMDIQMPVLDGMETTRRIRALEQAPQRTPVVALTAHAMTDQKTELLLAGLDDYLSKPISEDQLLHILHRWLNGNEEEQSEADALESEQPPAKDLSDAQPVPLNRNSDQPPAPVDISLCLKLSSHKADLARDMLQMLLKALPDQRQLIASADNNRDLTTLENVIHKIRGGASYCGVPQLQTTSAYADELLRKDQYDQKAIIAVIEAIDALLVWVDEIDVDALFELDAVN